MLGSNGWVPNNSVLLVLVYRGVMPPGDPDAVEALLLRNDWRPDWRDGVYSYHHYHSTTHEALACTSGEADLMLGGEGGRPVRIEAGDLSCCRRAPDIAVSARATTSCWSVPIRKGRTGMSAGRQRTLRRLRALRPYHSQKVTRSRVQKGRSSGCGAKRHDRHQHGIGRRDRRGSAADGARVLDRPLTRGARPVRGGAAA